MDTTKYEEMELDELKDYARSIGLMFGKIGKEKLIAQIVEHESKEETTEADNNDSESSNEDAQSSVLNDIVSAIDDLDDSDSEDMEPAEELPLDTRIPVKSITYGGLIYKSRTTNATFKWNKIGAVEYMTIAELNEMSNYKEAWLRTPYVILMDERAIKHFRLTPVYEKIASINNLDDVFKTENMTLIENTVDSALEANMRDILISKVRQMYQSKKLTNINIIRMLEEKLKFDLSDSE